MTFCTLRAKKQQGSSDKITKTRCCLVVNFVRRVPVKHGGVTNAHNTRCLNHPGRRAAIISQTHLSRSPERAYLQEAESSMVLLGNTSDVSVGNTRNIKILCGPPRQHHTQALKCLQKITCRVALFPALSLSVLQRDRLKLLRHQYRLCQFSTVSTNPGFNLLKFNVSGVFCFFFLFFFPDFSLFVSRLLQLLLLRCGDGQTGRTASEFIQWTAETNSWRGRD